MKRLFLISLAAVLSAFYGHSQNTKDVNIKDYTLELKEDGIDNLIKLGIAFSGKKVVIKAN